MFRIWIAWDRIGHVFRGILDLDLYSEYRSRASNSNILSFAIVIHLDRDLNLYTIKIVDLDLKEWIMNTDPKY